MKTKNYIYLTILSMAYLCFNETMSMDKKVDISSIIQNNKIKVTSQLHVSNRFQLTRAYLSFYMDTILFAKSSYYFYHYNTFVGMDTLEVTSEYRSRGLGEQIFYKTMYHIHENLPKIEDVTWDISPLDPPKDLSADEAFQLLFKFYRRVGATIDKEKLTGYINLKDAGYFDEN